LVGVCKQNPSKPCACWGFFINARPDRGDLLSLSEAEDLTRLCRSSLAQLAALPPASDNTVSKVVPVEKVGTTTQKRSPAELDPDVGLSEFCVTGV
jgi:hypothetical protein